MSGVLLNLVSWRAGVRGLYRGCALRRGFSQVWPGLPAPVRWWALPCGLQAHAFLVFLLSLGKLSLRHILMNFELGHFTFFSLSLFSLYVSWCIESSWSVEHLKALLCSKHQIILVEVWSGWCVARWCLERWTWSSGSLICRVHPKNGKIYYAQATISFFGAIIPTL